MSIKPLVLVAMSVFLNCNPVLADWADQDKYPIDKWTKQCVDKNPSTGGEGDCWEQAYKKWDMEMNKQYKRLIGVLKPSEQKNLQAGQLQWQKFRDLENKVIDDVYTHTSGSMFAPMQAASKVRVTRDRAILLEHYCDLVNGL